jgi:hypothetical protein
MKNPMLNYARNKGAFLKPGCQIRLTPEPQSFTLFNFNGKLFAGYFINEPHDELQWLTNAPIQQMVDASGKHIANVQQI